MLLVVTAALAASPPPIINGETTTDYPEVVLIYASDSSGYGGACTGSLIAERWVLTASHCVHSDGSFEVQGVWVSFVNDSNEMDEDNTLSAKAWYEHPDYNPSTGYNDIALIELRTKAEGPFMPLTDSKIGRDDVGQDFRIVGFGATSDTDRSSVQRKRVVDVPLEDYDQSLMHTLDKKDDQNACHGDSGGPVMRLYDDGTHAVAGIVDFGGSSCMRDGTYSARVDHFQDFIDDHTTDYTVWAEAEPEPEPEPEPEDEDTDGNADGAGETPGDEVPAVCSTSGSAAGLLAAVGAAMALRGRRRR